MSNRIYDPLFRGFSEKTGEGVFVFGPRIARAVIIHALTAGEDSVPGVILMNGGFYPSLPFSYRELNALWPQAVVDAVRGVPPPKKYAHPILCGLTPLLRRIRQEKARVGPNPEFDDAYKIARKLKETVFGEVLQWVREDEEVMIRKSAMREDWIHEILAHVV